MTLLRPPAEPLGVGLERLPGRDPALPLPAYETPGAAGMDLRACLPPDSRADGIALAPGARALIATGLRIAVPDGFEAQIRPRSGLALRHGLTVANAPGTIDSDYRGEVKVILANLGDAPARIGHGDRIAQIVIAPVARAVWREGPLEETERGDGGFGSTGVADV